MINYGKYQVSKIIERKMFSCAIMTFCWKTIKEADKESAGPTQRFHLNESFILNNWKAVMVYAKQSTSTEREGTDAEVTQFHAMSVGSSL